MRWLEQAALAGLLLAALLFFVFVPTYPNYDAYYHLVWGQELLDGVLPSFTAYQAPTEHPLYLLLSTLLVSFGEDAQRLLVLVTLLSLVALVWGVYRLGSAVFSRWSGAVAALFVASSFAFLLYAVRGYLDVPFLALVVWATMFELRRQRSSSVLALLALAGLLRPEAWLLAGLYWLWTLKRADSRRWLGLALVLLAPALWCLVDLSVTGDPLFSLHSTSELADELGRKRGIANVPSVLAISLVDTVRLPVVLLGLAGLILAWWQLGWRRIVVPLALLFVGVAVFVLSGAVGLALIPRYLSLPAVALCLFAGYGLTGFTELPAGQQAHRYWRAASAVAVVAGLVFAVWQAPSLSRLATELRFVRDSHDDLVKLLHTPAVQDGLRCGPLTFPNYRLVPDARFILDLPRERVGARSAQRRPYGVAVFTVGTKALKRFGLADGASPTTNVPDPGYRRNVRVGYFVAYLRCP